MTAGDATMPSDVTPEVGRFDRFAAGVSALVSRAAFFAFAVLLVVLWAPTLVFMDLNTSQLLINTATTIGTWLLVALLQNTQTRADHAVQHKLNALARGQAALMHAVAGSAGGELEDARRELCAAVGLEEREST